MRQRRIPIPLLILLLAAFMRLWHLGKAPPGLQHDEIFKAQEGRAIVEQGDIQLFYRSNQGHEGGYVWLIAFAYLIAGISTLTIKLPAFWCGMLTVALLYRVGTDLYNFRVGVLASGFAAVLFWLVFTNRVGLRANLLPVVVLIVIWGIWRVCKGLKPLVSPMNRQGGFSPLRDRWVIFTGITLGIAIYTYTSSIALYFAYAVFVGSLAILRWQEFKQHYRQLFLIGILGALLTLPMIRLRLQEPIGQDRFNTISKPWNDLKAGDPTLVIENGKKLAGMAFFTGDPEWRYNIKDRPLFVTPVGLLVYAGLLLLLWQLRRQPLNILLLALVVFGIVPSLLTSAAPSFLRSIVIAPSLLLALAVAIDQLGKIPGLNRAAWGIGFAAIAITVMTDYSAYFERWTNHPAANAIYRSDLRLLADYLRQQEEDLVLVSTLEPLTLDPSIYTYSGADLSRDISWFNGLVNIGLSETPRLLFVSPLAPISPAHAEWLTPAMGTAVLPPLTRQDGSIAFEVYQLAADQSPVIERLEAVSAHPVYLPPARFPVAADELQPLPYPINFGNVLRLRGYQIPLTTIPIVDNRVNDGLQLQLYLQPLTHDLNTNLSVFVHLIASDGRVLAGRDFLGAPATSWNPAMFFIQDNYVGNYNLTPGQYAVAVGLYDLTTGKRYPVLDPAGNIISDQVILGLVEAR